MTPQVRIGVGIWGLQSVPQRPDHHLRLYRDLIDASLVAESLGLDSLWLSEHHFWFDGYCPSVLTAAAAVLGATSRLKVGTAVLLLPLHPAAKVALDSLQVNRLSGGRLCLGMGLGYRDTEFDAFGLSRRERGRRMERSLADLVTILQAEPGIAPPVYVAVASLAAARRAGRFGLPMFVDSTLSRSQVVECLEEHRRASVVAANPAISHGIQRDVWMTDDPERDWLKLFPELRYMRRQYSAWSTPQAPGQSVEAYTAELDEGLHAKLGNLIFGAPDVVASRLRAFADLGFDLIVCRLQFGNVERSELDGSMRALAATAIGLVG